MTVRCSPGLGARIDPRPVPLGADALRPAAPRISRGRCVAPPAAGVSLPCGRCDPGEDGRAEGRNVEGAGMRVGRPTPERPQCHWCGHRPVQEGTCPTCGGPNDIRDLATSARYYGLSAAEATRRMAAALGTFGVADAWRIQG